MTRLITDLEGIHCDKCDCLIPRGEDAFNDNTMVYCESCFDKYLNELKEECRTEVNSYNFDLEEEG